MKIHTTNIGYLNKISHPSLRNKNTVFKYEKNKHKNYNKILYRTLPTKNLIPKKVGNYKNLNKQITSISNKKLMLLGGTNKRKRKLIDYANLNNSGFKNFYVLNNNEENSTDLTNNNKNTLSNIKSKSTEHINKMEIINLNPTISTSLSNETKLLGEKFQRNNIKEKRIRLSNPIRNRISYDQKEDIFSNQDYEKCKVSSEDSEWDPEKDSCVIKR